MTKKELDAQRKAMFAKRFKESKQCLKESEDTYFDTEERREYTIDELKDYFYDQSSDYENNGEYYAYDSFEDWLEDAVNKGFLIKQKLLDDKTKNNLIHDLYAAITRTLANNPKYAVIGSDQFRQVMDRIITLWEN